VTIERSALLRLNAAPPSSGSAWRQPGKKRRGIKEEALARVLAETRQILRATGGDQ
jgi:hypothetical protein